MSALRIAVALPHLGVYGGVRRFLELGRIWVARGHDVALLTPETRGVERPWLRFDGRVGTLEELRPGRWDAVLSPDPALFLDADAEGALRVFYAVLEGARGSVRAWRRADLVLANSAGMRRYLARRGVQAVDAAGGVNLEMFWPRDPDPRLDRFRAGSPVKALVYGRLSRPRKGSWAAARAVEAAARATGVSVELTLFDAPPNGEPEPKLPRALSIPFRWALRPTQEELRGLYADADLFVSGERRAGWCNTAAEAMACGAAVVCTRSGTEDFAVDGGTAAVARWPWAWALARKVAPLLRDPSARAALAARGRGRIAEFTWERAADRIERAIHERLGGKSNG
ncbi:MAG: glycosyltransferase family 4 protein [Candidatus Eisenbacteria bacterium]|uniref:Glycosyltransferase family 4 protein n=1 Tax=Eiseniibacteriota bacterium TaxID=2212470 RepID=A0A538TSS0_UNCEI|nr:MAG: glycosyltransferase family 4 protein [Candidatus Eisenbacteria bacterium]